jgi:predicted CoA-substrate-specific enzyme activase
MSNQKKYYLGIDVGSVSTNIVIMDSNDVKKVYESLYIRTNGQPIDAVKNGLNQVKNKGYQDEQILGVGVTGSARTLIGNMVGADVVKNEITAHAVAAISQVPGARTVLEIGGQDSKIIIIRDNVVVDFAMNSVCAAGTGSFLDQQAFRLKIAIEDFGDYALRAKESVRIAGRCTVFAESDMIHKQQLGFSKESIIAGLCEALVRNYLNNIGKGKNIESPILFQGGVAFNKGIKAAFEKELNKELIIPENFSVMGALGCAILAKEYISDTEKETKFRGFGIGEEDFSIRVMPCDGCGNNCELTQALSQEKSISIWGDRCGKWQNQQQ